MRLFPNMFPKPQIPYFRFPIFPFPKPLLCPRLYLLLLFYFQDEVEGNQVLTLISEREYLECSTCDPRLVTTLPLRMLPAQETPQRQRRCWKQAVMRGAQSRRAYCREVQLSIRPPWNF